jgi:hypothetical protein
MLDNGFKPHGANCRVRVARIPSCARNMCLCMLLEPIRGSRAAHHAGEVAGVLGLRAAQHARPHQEALLLHLHMVVTRVTPFTVQPKDTC